MPTAICILEENANEIDVKQANAMTNSQTQQCGQMCVIWSRSLLKSTAYRL